MESYNLPPSLLLDVGETLRHMTTAGLHVLSSANSVMDGGRVSRSILKLLRGAEGAPGGGFVL